MNSELNGSSYYRANPFYQQGYVPDSALRNRKSPAYLAEIPQGEKYFQPSNRKHFQRLGYYSTIAQENIMNNDNKDYDSSPARDKEFFRSLNINDIEGAATNTLISQAVKNRMKAQEHLMRRSREQREEEVRQKVRQFSQIEDNRKREEALVKIKSKKQPNYHELVKKMRTEQSQGMPSPMQQKIRQRQIINQQQFNQNNQFHNQLQQTQYQIMQLEKQLREVRRQNQKNNQKTNSFHLQSLPNNQKQDIQSEDNHKYQRDQTPNVITNQCQQPQFNSKRYPHQNYIKIQNNPSQNISANPLKINYPQKNYNQPISQNIANMQGNIDRDRQRSLTDKLIPKTNTYGQQLIRKQQEQSYQDARSMVNRESRQQHRKFNPTFLSFGSASIGLAGRNIVGF